MVGVAATMLWAAPAIAQERQRYSIPSGDAAQTVQRIAIQSGVQVMVPDADLSGVTTNPVSGNYTPLEALRRMFAGKGVEVVQNRDGAIVIRRAAAADAQASTVETTGEEIIVTGSRIRRPGYDTLEATIVSDAEEFRRRGYTNVIDALNDTPGFVPSDVNTIGSDQRSLTAGQNFADFFGLGSQRTLTLVNGRRFVSSNTISGAGGSTTPGGQVDLNLIPAGLIERVETIAIGGAPIYGADAISGTVNVILRDDFEGAELTAQVGLTEKGDAPSYTFRGLVGTNFAGERGNVALGVEYNRQDGLLKSTRTGRTFMLPDPDGDPAPNQYARDLVYDYMTDGGLPFTTSLGRIVDAQGTPLQFGGGGGLVPYIQGTQLSGPIYDGGDGFRFADHQSLLSPTERVIVSALGHFDISSSVTLFAEGSHARSTGYELSELSVAVSPVFNTVLPVSLSNPFLSDSARSTLTANGVTDNFFFARNLSDIVDRDGGLYRNRVELWRGVVGLKGQTSLFGEAANWDVALNYGRSRSKATTKYINNDRFLLAVDAIEDGNGNIVCRSGGDCVPLNLFGENAFSDEAAAYVIDEGSAVSLNQQFVVNANFNGSLPFRIASEAIDFNIGAEYRKEKGAFTPDAILSQPSSLLGFTFVAPYAGAKGSFHTKEIYGELSVPLVSPDQDWPVIKSLSVEGAARYVDHSLAGGDLTWSAGGRFSPRLPGIGDGLQFRGVYTRSIRSPGITELFSGASPTRGALNDPCDRIRYQEGNNPTVRAANCAAALQAFGTTPASFVSTTAGVSPVGTISGNPNLENEKARSWSAGVVYQPTAIPGLRLAADWSEIKLTGGIQRLAIGNLLEACYDSANFPNEPSCDAFRRLSASETGPGTANPIRIAGDIADGYNSGYVNVASIKFAGLIMSAEYGFALSEDPASGRLQFGAKLFHNDRYDVQTSAAAVPTSSVGTSATPKWSGQFNTAYVTDALDLSLQALWSGPAKVNILFDSEDVPDADNLIGTYWRFNATVGVKVAERFRMQLAVSNLFDRKPSQAQLNSQNYGRYDLLGRRYLLTATAGF
ncbi:MAG TPA: TonB-dependent receptor [Sphingopyxis sp.]|nr:TonB-dependent receptor [Sphingopyxis sp.]